MKQKKYDKLVRDRIPETIKEANKQFSTHRAGGASFRRYAMDKLREEVEEFLENPCSEEAADILEIFDLICKKEGITRAAINAHRTSKWVVRGGFESGLVLDWVEEE